MRALVSIGVFQRDAQARFSNNRLSTGLVTGTPENIRGFTEFFGLEPMVRSFADIDNTLRDGQVSFQRVNGRHVWEWLAADDAARGAFVEGMNSMTEGLAPIVAASYPFQEVKKGCDVGGGVGAVLSATLARHPHLGGMLFDDPSMLEAAPRHLDQWGVTDRVELVAGSLFEEVPRGADAYIPKTVVHDWRDEDALRILKNVRAAMDPGHRLLVVDFVDQPDDALSALVPFMDILGMQVFGGRERTPEQMARLSTDAGFAYKRLIPLPASQGVFEGVAVA